MARPRPTRLYLRTETNKFRRLLWVHHIGTDEMMLGFSAMTKGLPLLRLEWPERLLREQDLGALDYHWPDAASVKLPIDHVSYHSDGFHVKTAQVEDRYVHRVSSPVRLGPDTPTFLRFQLLSDAARHYGDTTSTAKKPHVWIAVPPDHVVIAEGAFAGSRHPLLNYVTSRLAALGPAAQVTPAVHLTSGELQGMVWWRATRPPNDWINSRPRGTIVSFKFPRDDGEALIKTFVIG